MRNFLHFAVAVHEIENEKHIFKIERRRLLWAHHQSMKLKATQSKFYSTKFVTHYNRFALSAILFYFVLYSFCRVTKCVTK